MREINVSFFQKYGILVIASVLALALAAYAAYRVSDREKEFNRTRETLNISEGYDKRLIDMVKELEDELAERARFGYAGRKDPMSGTTRIVAERPAPQVRKTVRRQGGQPGVAAAEIDPVRLTAIIFDNTRRTYTAIVMDGERSFSVAVGDRVAGRRITRITSDEIQMENDVSRFVYNIMGGSTKVRK
ncbi:MAG: hypothetical protein FWC23_08180 [Chitinispirillia bacterium]|nr:hypothetical protein [Chitinispirillia bacterium]MCL2269150.1 hypothetical protein [Chitinispirillia bacterium]